MSKTRKDWLDDLDHDLDAAGTLPKPPRRLTRREKQAEALRATIARQEAAYPVHDDAATRTSLNIDMSGRFQDAVSAAAFMRAGKATVTLKSLKSGVRFTYRVSVSDDGECHFVGLLNGSDNETNYAYLGRISRNIFWAGRKVPKVGDVSRDAPSVKAFAWTWQQLMQGNLPDTLEIWHEGRCGRCGRKLTVPESIRAGIGPECAGRI